MNLSDDQMFMAWRLWCKNLDTLEIAEVLRRTDKSVTEAAVYNGLRKVRDQIRAGKAA